MTNDREQNDGASQLRLAGQFDRVEAEQARALYRNCPVSVIGAMTGALVLASGFAATGRVDVATAQLWSGLMVGCVALHLGLCVLYSRTKPPPGESRRWLWAFTAVAGLEGLTWFFGAIWLTPPGNLTQELIVILVSVVMVSVAVPVFSAYLPTYAVFSFPTIAPHLGFALVYDYPLHDMMAVLIFAYLVVMWLFARNANIQLVEGLRLRFENVDLAENLRVQKDLADQANLAKSSFLASASHDLRQPIHALGLFIGALRGRQMDDEARRLVDHIGGSVSAMDDLFASLLDISKLDAGIVQPSLEPVDIGPLLDRLCREHAEEAVAKGIELRLVECSVPVSSDPVLLERIIRNLVSNAVRYTDLGRVLVGCRRTMDSVSVEVWDTGRGVAPAQQARIFEEFYQIDNPERDRSKGLGLGLAIVKRMTPLIGGDLQFTSEPGRGSLFKLRVPRSVDARSMTSEEQTLPVGAMRHGLVLVIDDEVAIQTAMTTLLESWGHRVIVAGSVEEMIARIVDCPDRPDVIISDYRLRAEENGIDAIRRLRGEYNDDIPAMLITGDTAPDRINEALASGLPLLHKPLTNSKLRAAIGNLLRESRG